MAVAEEKPAPDPRPTDAERQAVWQKMVEADGRVARLEREMKELRRRLEGAAKRAAGAVR
jgi:hypothetical protein